MNGTRHRLAQYIADHSQSDGDRRKLAREVAALLLTDHGTAELDSLLRDVRRLRLDQHGILDVTVVSAHEVTDRVLADVRQVLKSEFPGVKQVMVSTRIEPSVIGGIRLEMPDEELNLTVRRKLAIFRHLTVKE